LGYRGTPFLGSMSTLGTLSEGWGTIPNWLAGGIDTIRRTALSFPSLLELLPRYRECCSFKRAENQYLSIDARAGSGFAIRLKLVQRQAYLQDFFYWGQIDSIDTGSGVPGPARQ